MAYRALVIATVLLLRRLRAVRLKIYRYALWWSATTLKPRRTFTAKYWTAANGWRLIWLTSFMGKQKNIGILAL